VKAVVLEILSEERREIPGTETVTSYQTLRAKVLQGEKKGDEVVIENDYLNLKEGERFYLLHTVDAIDKTSRYAVAGPYRLPMLVLLAVLFLVVLAAFGGMQGIRGLVALMASLFFIMYALLPALLQGYSPVLVAMGVASLIIIVGSYITHGVNRTTSAAVLGMVCTIFVTGALAYVAVDLTRLTGFESDEAVYLNFSTRGAIDFAGLLLGGILIGLLGVLYDVAIGQAVSVEELARAGAHLDRRTIYARAVRIGREHIGALVNTLAIAYVGASLPLLLLFYSSDTGTLALMNQEIFATEIVRTMVGSIGLVLAVPITTLIAVFLLVKKA